VPATLSSTTEFIILLQAVNKVNELSVDLAGRLAKFRKIQATHIFKEGTRKLNLRVNVNINIPFMYCRAEWFNKCEIYNISIF